MCIENIREALIEDQARQAAEVIGEQFAKAGWPNTAGNPPDLMDLSDQARLDGVLPESGFGPDFQRGFFSVRNRPGRQ